MSVQIVQNQVELFARIDGNQLIHEIQKLTPAAATIMSRMDQSGRHLQCRSVKDIATLRPWLER
jgi:hypothetical protein